MNSGLKLQQMIGHVLVRAGRKMLGHRIGQVENQFRFSNPFGAAVIRRTGVKMEPRIVQVVNGFNDVTVVGKNHLLDVTFGNSSPVTQIATWYIGLVNNSPTPVFVEGDTLSSHSGWTEFAGYTGNRQAWVDANAASKIKSSSSASEFAITSDAAVNGIFIASAASGTSGILWASGSFDETVDVIIGDTLRVTYGIRT